ncbi:MAG: DUF3473 domain-containing protein [Desulfohalobiaceae bacterium]|nr:DUF3473 domain-containing protein [Desulfohalobiaceae bacterium]
MYLLPEPGPWPCGSAPVFSNSPSATSPWAGPACPGGGGGYFRLIPLSIFQLGIRAILRRAGGYCFYLHPWEIDPGQPRVREAPPLLRFRQYCNLQRTGPRLTALLEQFQDCRFVTCSEYLELLDNQNP